jgi:hypothetical protein
MPSYLPIYSFREPDDVSSSGRDTHIPIRPAQAISALHTLRQWELEQDDGNRDVVRQLDAIKRRIKALQVTRKEQRTLDGFLGPNRSSVSRFHPILRNCRVLAISGNIANYWRIFGNRNNEGLLYVLWRPRSLVKKSTAAFFPNRTSSEKQKYAHTLYGAFVLPQHILFGRRMC